MEATSSSRGRATIRPAQVHVLRDGRLVLKWDLERGRPMRGFAPAKLVALVRELEEEGLL